MHPDMKKAMNETFNKLMSMSTEDFAKELELRGQGDIAEMMIESGAAEIICKEISAVSFEHCHTSRWRSGYCNDETIEQSFNGRMSASKSEDEGSIPSCSAK